ncbi:class I SAM-dependent methyltransferase [Nonomuraea sp. N2-4H]|uniref:class I SAM-dependent methyltransferase n=1 Tax=Nonomuraea sp. N2-4H TaxID=3128898 RepID=UPI00324E0868
MAVDRKRSVIFGEAVEQYEAARPGYAERLVTDVLDYAPSGPVLEVGAGTGKATAGFAARVSDLTCVEPDPRMAAALTAKCPGVRVVSGTFEEYVPDRPFALLYSAQAWHWVDHDLRWDLACAALAPSGALALFWSHYVPADPELHAALVRLAHRYGVTSQSLHQDEGDRAAEAHRLLAADPRFTGLDRRRYTWTERYDTARFVTLAGTLSAYRILAPDVRERVLGEMGALVGDGLDMTFTTDLVLARRT